MWALTQQPVFRAPAGCPSALSHLTFTTPPGGGSQQLQGRREKESALGSTGKGRISRSSPCCSLPPPHAPLSPRHCAEKPQLSPVPFTLAPAGGSPRCGPCMCLVALRPPRLHCWWGLLPSDQPACGVWWPAAGLSGLPALCPAVCSSCSGPGCFSFPAFCSESPSLYLLKLGLVT